MEKTFQIGKFTYRIKRMNAIEVLALRAIVNFDNFDKVMKCYETLLEKVEVNVTGEKWLQVKSGDAYYPNDVENDAQTIEQLISKVLAYIKSVFQKSDVSKE